MNLIFLDIDGVLNSHNFFSSRVSCKSILDDIDPNAVEILNKIVDKTGASVVISSTWRKIRTHEEIHKILVERGYRHNNVIGSTPVMDTVRGIEIDWFLKEMGFNPVYYDKDLCQSHINSSKIKNYLILDDEPDMLYIQKNNLLVTNMQSGLLSEHVDICVDILSKNFVDLYF